MGPEVSTRIKLSETKVGRAQFVILPPEECTLALHMLRWLKRNTDTRMPFALGATTTHFTKAIQKSSKELGLPPYTGHSGRAGFVSDQALKGKSVEQIMTITRHSSVASMKVYMDAVTHAQQVHHGPVARWVDPAIVIERNPHLFFPQLAYHNTVYDVRRRVS